MTPLLLPTQSVYLPGQAILVEASHPGDLVVTHLGEVVREVRCGRPGLVDLGELSVGGYGVAQPSIKRNNLYSLREAGSEVYLTIYSLDGGLKDYVTGKTSRVITDVTADGFTLLRFEGATSLSDNMAFKRR